MSTIRLATFMRMLEMEGVNTDFYICQQTRHVIAKAPPVMAHVSEQATTIVVDNEWQPLRKKYIALLWSH